MEERPIPTIQEVKQRVDGGESADSPAIAVSADRAKESFRIPGNHRLEHLSILALDPLQHVRGDRTGIAKAGTHVGEVGPGDEAGAMLLRVQEIRQGLKEASNHRIIRGELLSEDPFVERATQDRKNPDGTLGTEKVLQEDDLEFDRVLCSMGNVVHRQGGTAPPEFVEHGAVRPNMAKGGLEIFPADSEGLGSSGMGRPQNDE
jgi:hypothetical protein